MVAAAPCSLCNSEDIDPQQLARLAQEPRLTTKTITDLGRAQETSLVLRLLAQLQQVRGEVNIFHYNAALNALATGNSWPRALSTLFLLCRRQLADKTSFSATITACSSERWPMAFSLISRHSLACLECDIVAVGAAAACGVPWPRASRLLASLQLKQVQVNVVACSALMASCEQSGAWARAIHGFRDMQLIGVQPNVVTYSTTTSSYNTAFLWRAAAQMVGMCLSDREVRVGAGGSRTVVCNSALGALSKSRQWLEVFNVLHDMRLCTLQTSRVSCSLAVECCQAKQWRKGVGILEHMRLSNILLNEVKQSQATLDHASSAKHGKATRDNHSASAMVSMSAKNPHVCLAAVILWNNWVEAVDQSEFCPRWAAAGECARNADYMLKACPASCSSTGTASQTSSQSVCAQWAGGGECQKNPTFMLKDSCSNQSNDHSKTNRHHRAKSSC
ncbi:Pentatricopeptide repeat-containing protein, chloroplastic [Symbiodinium microadriaticum]|uniref:Pentatricopeptide repeat-containing protein, chloroplastic n=1 Tax=Symbiodinium microadriaticum TaxID=2951 RepID=A0A1Q9CK10_SYMMI|nr:Pentatricopeptide repeat-containing protein, chloroplastic [Symbiodinium microadriaticum]